MNEMESRMIADITRNLIRLVWLSKKDNLIASDKLYQKNNIQGYDGYIIAIDEAMKEAENADTG